MPERVVVRKRKAPFDSQKLVETFRSWAHYKGDEERAKGLKETLRSDVLFPTLETHGEVDDKGSYILTFPEAVTVQTLDAKGVKKSVTYTGLKKEKRPRLVFLEDKARAWLEKNGFLDQVEVVSRTSTFRWDFNLGKTVQDKEEHAILDQDAIYLLNQEGNIPDKTLDSFFEEQVTWALVPIKA